jgi:hypothetical protein
MILDNTTDVLQFKLGSSVTATQLDFDVSYNTITSTTVTPAKLTGVSNNGTAVTLMSSPGASEQKLLKGATIYNNDTTSKTILILYYNGTTTTQIFNAILAPSDVLKYTLEKGWEAFDSKGSKKFLSIRGVNNAIRRMPALRPSGLTGTLSLTTGTTFITYMGKADKAYTSITFQFKVTTLASTITWAEAGVVTNNRFIELGFYERKGYTDISAVVNTTGLKTVTVPVSGINAGDELCFTLGISATVTAVVRTCLITDEYARYLQSVVARLSLTPCWQNTADLTSAPIMFAWQAT